MVFNLLDLSWGWKQLVEMAFPSCWVISRPIFTNGGPVEHALDSSTQAGGRLGFCLPDGLKYLQDVVLTNVLDKKVAYMWICVGLQGGTPLCSVLWILPSLSNDAYQQ